MSLVRVLIKCKCGNSTTAAVTKPRSGSKQSGVTTCNRCLSQIEYEISKDNDDLRNSSVNVKSRMISISKQLEEILGK